ncbi:MAG: DUF4129 domain-containing protein [Anaerolineales bacterium]|nr:DUF4129 domain-containing protein [Anaerolineales bacterium]
MAGARGRPRRPAETPLELVGPLSAVFPGGEGEIQALTKAFQEARYGGVVDSPARLQAARQALDFLKTRAHNADRGHA